MDVQDHDRGEIFNGEFSHGFCAELRERDYFRILDTPGQHGARAAGGGQIDCAVTDNGLLDRV